MNSPVAYFKAEIGDESPGELIRKLAEVPPNYVLSNIVKSNYVLAMYFVPESWAGENPPVWDGTNKEIT